MAKKVFHQVDHAVDEILRLFENHIKIAAPLGLGKPNPLLNRIYDQIKADQSRTLTIYTALSLTPPNTKSDLGKRFFDPFKQRYWGNNYPELAYSKDARKNQLPHNIKVHEFYLLAGSGLYSTDLQRNYQSINYTHVCPSIFRENIQVVMQLIAQNPKSQTPEYSLSSNPDVTLDLIDLYQKHSKPLLKIGVVHPDLPFVGGQAQVPSDLFDMIIDDPTCHHELFAIPPMPISDTDHAIGFHASQMIQDGGTLQIGIGSLSDAIVSSVILRHKNAKLYSELIDFNQKNHFVDPNLAVHTDPFEQGLYGLSEMVSDGYMHLRQAGILKRQVTDELSGVKTYLHGAFFLGSKRFYSWIRSLSEEDFTGFQMTRVSHVNDIYDANETLLREQRKHPRFLNTCMQVSLLGGAASETLENGRVVSGVGGQYNFVAMSHELENSRSILMLRSVREHKGKRTSNIVWSLSNQTIPRHLRDMVITEYGIADVRGKTDEDTICAILNITDSEFQENLLATAKKNGKVHPDYQIPESAKRNTPENLKSWIRIGKNQGVFSPFALGSDFTPEEEKLALALEKLQHLSANPKWSAKWKIFMLLIQGWRSNPAPFQAELKRMDLDKPRGVKQWILFYLLLGCLGGI